VAVSEWVACRVVVILLDASVLENPRRVVVREVIVVVVVVVVDVFDALTATRHVVVLPMVVVVVVSEPFELVEFHTAGEVEAGLALVEVCAVGTVVLKFPLGVVVGVAVLFTLRSKVGEDPGVTSGVVLPTVVPLLPSNGPLTRDRGVDVDVLEEPDVSLGNVSHGGATEILGQICTMLGGRKRRSVRRSPERSSPSTSKPHGALRGDIADCD